MKYVDEFRDGTIAIGLSKKIASLVNGYDETTIMEVCGSHTMSIYRYGLKKLLPSNIRLLSGPGCPVCVTPTSYIDTAIAISQKYSQEVLITTFGEEKRNLTNYFVLTSHKVMPPVMEALLRDKELNLDGFLCPAHVSTIIGSKPYEFIARDFHIPCVIAGFEPLDILQGIYMLLEQITRKESSVRIQYSRVAKYEGNPTALALLDRVFEPCEQSGGD